jgi:formamidopyrimidine-DNA glycosylase
MSEGPQVKLITERLQRQLLGHVIKRCKTTRTSLELFSKTIPGSQIKRIFCKGKHIFFEFDSGIYLHNHLLMRGRWRRSSDRFLILSSEIWLAFELAKTTVYNCNGQVLKVLDSEQVNIQLNSLGPDVMSADCLEDHIIEAIASSEGTIGETLLDQFVLSGIGNVAKSESLFLAGLHPQIHSIDLSSDESRSLAKSIRHVMWESYRAGGHWTHRVYRRAKNRCFECGTRIQMIRQGKQNRSTYFCPRCQIKP